MSESLTAAARVAIARHPQRPNITDYIDAEIRKMNAGEDYDTRIIDPTTGEPVEFPN